MPTTGSRDSPGTLGRAGASSLVHIWERMRYRPILRVVLIASEGEGELFVTGFEGSAGMAGR